jgi:hypothetical protein
MQADVTEGTEMRLERDEESLQDRSKVSKKMQWNGKLQATQARHGRQRSQWTFRHARVVAMTCTWRKMKSELKTITRARLNGNEPNVNPPARDTESGLQIGRIITYRGKIGVQITGCSKSTEQVGFDLASTWFPAHDACHRLPF